MKIWASRGMWNYAVYGKYLRTRKGQRQHRRMAFGVIYKRKNDNALAAAERILEKDGRIKQEDAEQVRVAILFHEVCSR